MTSDVVHVEPTAPVAAIAEQMRRFDIGDVLVTEGGRLVGIVTDRDLVTRVLAGGRDPESPVGAVATKNPVTLDPEQPLDQATEIMLEQAVRRLPVVDGGRPVGILSLGDMAIAHADGGASPSEAEGLLEMSAEAPGSTRQAAIREGAVDNPSVPEPASDVP